MEAIAHHVHRVADLPGCAELLTTAPRYSRGFSRPSNTLSNYLKLFYNGFRHPELRTLQGNADEGLPFAACLQRTADFRKKEYRTKDFRHHDPEIKIECRDSEGRKARSITLWITGVIRAKNRYKSRRYVMEVNPTSHTPAHNVTAAAAPFQA